MITTKQYRIVDGERVFWKRGQLQFDPIGTRVNAENNVSQLEVIGAQNRLNTLVWVPPGEQEYQTRPRVPTARYVGALREYQAAIHKYKLELKAYMDSNPICFGLRANEEIDCPLLAMAETNAET